MSELFFYRANVELTADLRAYRDIRDAWWDRVVAPYAAQHPDNQPLWSRTGGQSTCVGFADDKPDEPAPAGLSRAKTRTYLRPARGKPGDEWRELIDTFNTAPQLSEVFQRFGLGPVLGATSGGQGVLYSPNWLDLAMVDGPVVVYIGHEYATVPDCLEPMPRSEFYALHEKATALEDCKRAGAS